MCRVGNDYFLATSSFEYFPGAPIFHSRDLVAWEQIGNILTRRSQFAVGDGRPSGGIFGSTLRHHNEEFWFVTTNMSDFGGGHLLLRAKDPAGPWSDPVQIPGTLGIDPDIAWDSEGNCYLTWVGFGPAENESGIVQARLDPNAGRLLESPRKVWQGTGLAYPEGPHLYEAAGWWYLILAEGGTDRGHAVSVSRGSSPAGPFEPYSDNPILSHRSTAAPVQSVGHADLVETATGEWAAVHLGVRPRGVVPGYHVLGRETFVAGISWDQGWPRFDQDRYHVPAVDSSFSDDFSSPSLHPRWVSPGQDPASFTTDTPAGLLIGQSQTGSAPILATRVLGNVWSARATVLLPGDEVARLLLRIDDSHWYGIEASGRHIEVVAQIGPLQQVVATAEIDPDLGPIHLEIACNDSPLAGLPGKNTGPDEVSLGFREHGQLTTLARMDGRYLSTEVAGGFTGRVIGLAATNGSVIVKRFEYNHRD
ncbi:xylan 1,4-beta-xylosidase [Arthrobacter ulcerisalmonis]|nr:xylan 1,4-beta-xylosidase [Arthrobacter ulcerisalmonis]